MTIFVLTREINEYYQEGEYFVAVFKEKPTADQLFMNGVEEKAIKHVMAGGGRTKAMENEWFHLREHTI